jgi:hypothetical protein
MRAGDLNDLQLFDPISQAKSVFLNKIAKSVLFGCVF